MGRFSWVCIYIIYIIYYFSGIVTTFTCTIHVCVFPLFLVGRVLRHFCMVANSFNVLSQFFFFYLYKYMCLCVCKMYGCMRSCIKVYYTRKTTNDCYCCRFFFSVVLYIAVGFVRRCRRYCHCRRILVVHVIGSCVLRSPAAGL